MSKTANPVAQLDGSDLRSTAPGDESRSTPRWILAVKGPNGAWKYNLDRAELDICARAR